MKPPPTTLEDILLMLGLCVVAVTLAHLLRIAFGFQREVSGATERAKRLVPTLEIDSASAFRVVRSFHLTVPSFVAAYAPVIALVIGFSTCSLLRDAGYVILPWLIPLACVFSGLVGWLAADWRRRAIVDALLELHSHSSHGPAA
jgi:hypothetical protein